MMHEQKYIRWYLVLYNTLFDGHRTHFLTK